MFRYLLIRWGNNSRIFRLAPLGVLLFACHPGEGGAKNFEMDFKFLKDLIISLSILESYAQRFHI